MPVIRISQQQLEYGKILDPAWYPVKLKAINRKQSKNKDSVNCFIDFEMENGRVLEGYPSTCVLNNKVEAQFWPRYIKLVSALIGRPVKDGDEIDKDKLIGKPLKIQVDNDTYNGQLQNKVIDFAPIDAETTTPF